MTIQTLTKILDFPAGPAPGVDIDIPFMVKEIIFKGPTLVHNNTAVYVVRSSLVNGEVIGVCAGYDAVAPQPLINNQNYRFEFRDPIYVRGRHYFSVCDLTNPHAHDQTLAAALIVSMEFRGERPTPPSINFS
jgi:hypothetical protein